MEQRKYLITGATGKTGVHTIRFLLKEGHAVRASHKGRRAKRCTP
jgi:uncharacterized protein YbjT (DUF2867 family)